MATNEHIRTRIPTVFDERLQRAFPEHGSVEARVYAALKSFFENRGILDLPFHPEPPSLNRKAPAKPRARKMRTARPRRARVRRMPRR